MSKPICSCGSEMKLVQFNSHYEKFTMWWCTNDKCTDTNEVDETYNSCDYDEDEDED